MLYRRCYIQYRILLSNISQYDDCKLINLNIFSIFLMKIIWFYNDFFFFFGGGNSISIIAISFE